MRLHRSGTLPTARAPEEGFTGDVSVSDYVALDPPSRLICARVFFPPGARTPWKVNPLGQTLIVTDGVGRAQEEGSDVVEIRAGDIVCFPPGQRHWEGATPEHGLTCLVIQERQDGRAVEFGRRVDDEEYGRGPRQA